MRFYVLFVLLLVLICLLLYNYIHQTLLLHFSTYFSPNQQRPVHLLILSSWRSGSSFVGQIFNNHPKVFYLFEPGHTMWMKFCNETAELLHYPVRDLLHSLFTCDISPLYPYLPLGGKIISELTYFAESRALCSFPACKHSVPFESYERNRCSHRCANTSLEKMVESCKAHSHVVMKTVRILDLTVLLPLFRDPALDLRILHLVRDPRAITSSRKYFSLSHDDQIMIKGTDTKQENVSTVVQVMTKICNSQIAINKVAKTVGHSLRGRYMLLRHEDLVKEPISSVKRMYNFAGLSLSKRMKQWIYNITHLEISPRGDFMTFSKNSRKVVNKWRGDLEFPLVEEIQNVCQEAMEHFGYLPVKSLREQKNPRVNLIVDMNIDEHEEDLLLNSKREINR